MIALGLTVLQATPAGAAPSAPEPSTSADAKTAWIEASRKAEVVNEQVLDAKITQQKAAAVARTAAAKVAATKVSAAAAVHRVQHADAAVLTYQTRIDRFTGASFRGARLSQMTLLLTATSADDFLDSATALDRVAADTQKTLAGALIARTDATQARSSADAAAAAAVSAKTDADTATAAAVAQTKVVSARQTDLKAQIATYKKLYDQLTEKERLEAIAAAEEAARQEAARQQAAAEQAAREQAAAEQSAADQSAADQSAADQSAADQSAADQSAARQRADRGVARTTPAGSAPSAASASSAPAATSAASSSPADAPTTAQAPAPNSKGEIAVQAALSKVGDAYVWGAAGPDAFDCSGLMMWAWAQAGVSLPHSSAEQSGYQDVPMDQLQPGDLVTYYSPVSHVAMYIGNGQVVHASTESRPVLVTGVYDAGPDASGHRVTG